MPKEKSSLPGIIMIGLALSVGLAACATNGTGAITKQYIDDAAISAKVKANLLHDPVVSGLSIQVETHNGNVQLSGFAKSNIEIKQAERLTRRTAGVRSVINEILLGN